MKLVPVDADAAIGQALVAAVERDVLADAVAVLFDELLCAAERRLLFGGEDEDQVAFRFNAGLVYGADRSQQRFDVAGVVADAGRKDFAVADLGLDRQAVL